MLFNVPFKAHFETRYLFAEAYRPGESLYGTAGYRLMVRKSAPDCSDLNFLRQIGFLLDRDEFKSGRVRPLSPAKMSRWFRPEIFYASAAIY